ncbi:MAG TPA: hypothetical protein DCY53_05610 [Desulfobacteraceae bacterium]|nr:hypothetical protein [Desulfobacteraceae bacterium]
MSGSIFNPQNTLCIPVVKNFAFLELEQKFIFFKGLYIVFVLWFARKQIDDLSCQLIDILIKNLNHLYLFGCRKNQP